MSQLREHKGDDMTPRQECSRLLVYLVFASKFGNEMIRNEVAKLPKD